MQEKMTVSKGLKELKLSSDKITKTISQMNPYAVLISGKLKGVAVPASDIDKFKADQLALKQSVESLIGRRTAIKNAIVLSNANTKVTIAGKEYTVAEAIEMKSGVSFLTELKRHLSNVSSRMRADLNKANEEQDYKVQQLINTLTGSDKNASTKNFEDQINIIKDQFKIELVESYDAEAVIKVLEKQIEDFELEVDDVLATSNATTEITVNY